MTYKLPISFMVFATYFGSKTALACWSLVAFFSSRSFSITRFNGVGFFCFGVSRILPFFLAEPCCACFSISEELYSRRSSFFCSSWISAYSRSAFCWARNAFLPCRLFSRASELSQSVKVKTSAVIRVGNVWILFFNLSIKWWKTKPTSALISDRTIVVISSWIGLLSFKYLTITGRWILCLCFWCVVLWF